MGDMGAEKTPFFGVQIAPVVFFFVFFCGRIFKTTTQATFGVWPFLDFPDKNHNAQQKFW